MDDTDTDYKRMKTAINISDIINSTYDPQLCHYLLSKPPPSYMD